MSFGKGTARISTNATLTLFLIFATHDKLIGAIDVNPQKEIYVPNYLKYHNLTATAAHLHQTSAKYYDFVKIDYGYSSRNQNPQLLTRITNFSYPRETGSEDIVPQVADKSAITEASSKIRIILSYGEHAREFFPVESFFHLLTNITAGLSTRADKYAKDYTRMILSNFDIYAIVMANPDGRSHVELSHNYCWRGTSTGVDLNRNFDWQFAKTGSSGNPKDEEYRGPQPFSEPECQVYIDLTEKLKFDAFISFHTGVRHIYMPFADTASKVARREPANFRLLSELAVNLANSTKYKFHCGKAYDLNFYTADGTAFDYMSAVRKIPFSLAIEMWGNSQHTGVSCFDEFNPNSERLQEELEAFYPMYTQLFSYLLQWKRQQQEPASSPVKFLLLGVLLILLFFFVLKYRQNIWSTKRRIIHVRRLGSMFLLSRISR